MPQTNGQQELERIRTRRKELNRELLWFREFPNIEKEASAKLELSQLADVEDQLLDSGVCALV